MIGYAWWVYLIVIVICAGLIVGTRYLQKSNEESEDDYDEYEDMSDTPSNVNNNLQYWIAYALLGIIAVASLGAMIYVLIA